MFLRQIFDPYLSQYAYLIGCQRTGDALVIDPERDIDQYRRLAGENGLRITAVAETHIHADFVSGAREFAADQDVRVHLSGEGGPDWSHRWTAGHENVRFLKDGDDFSVGHIRIQAIHTPGHTPEHLCFSITDRGGGADEPIALAAGDFVFVGDVGRPDLLETAAGLAGSREPSARQLQASLRHRLSIFGDYLQLLPAHGAGSACGKELGAVPTTTLGYERRFNHAFRLAASDRDAFVREILSGQPEPPLYFATMKRLNRDGIAVTGGVPAPPRLSAGEFACLAGQPGTRILDAREDREAFIEKHVARSLHSPLRTPFFSKTAGSYLREDDAILLVLERAEDAPLAARQLYRIGFDHVAGWILAEDTGKLFDSAIPRVHFADFEAPQAREEGEIIDARTRAEFDEGHLPGARSYPYTRLPVHLDELPRDRRLFVHCAKGTRALIAVSFLRSEGFDAVHVDGAFAA